MTLSERLLAPKVVLPVLALVILLLLITTPRDFERQTAHLTTYSVHPMGARAFARLAERLGWTVERRLTPLREPLDATATYVLLAPAVPVTSVETSHLLDAVRRGARVLYVIGERHDSFADSLRLQQSRWQFRPLPLLDEQGTHEQAGVTARARGAFEEGVRQALEARGPLPADTVMFLAVRAPRRQRFDPPAQFPPGVEYATIMRAAVLGIPYGAGRIVVVAEPALLTNHALRDAETSILFVRALEWLAPTGTRLIISEFHQGFGAQPSTLRAVRSVLLGTPAGRAVVALALAVAILMLAMGVRPIAPLPAARIERRSALEHVDALASAYERVEGTRAATQRLLRGLKRRHLPATARSRTDEEYLEALASRYPALRQPAARVRHALHTRVSAEELAEVGGALNIIERTITT